MKTTSMKSAIFISITALLLLSSCTSKLYRDLPEGTFISNDHRIVLDSDGSFILENIGNTNDGRDFTLEGSYTSSRDKIDEDNDSYGTITFTVSKLTMNGSGVTSLYLDEDYSAESSKVTAGSRLEGWWAYSENITWGGMMRVWFNWPGFPRRNNFYDGHDELFSGDP